MKQKIFLMLALLTFCLVQNPAQAQGIFTPEEILSKYSSDPNSVVGLIMKVKFTGTSTTNWEVKSGSNTIAFRKDDNPDLNANTEYVALTTFTAIEGQPGWYKATGSSYTPSKAKEPESPCNRHYESAVKFIVDTPVVHTFTVSQAGAKVIFSPGNLQYCPAKDQWRFALRQYDRCGNGLSVYGAEGHNTKPTAKDSNITNVFYDSIDYATKDDNGNYTVIKNIPCNNEIRSKTYQGWIDMFSWGTSGQGRKVGDEYTVHFYPYEHSNTNFGGYNAYGLGPSYDEGHGEGALNNNFDKKSGTNRLFDWGYANFIREYHGSVFDDEGHWQYSTDSTMYHTGIWRVLSMNEWRYLLTERKVEGNDSAFTYVLLQYGKNAYDTLSGMIIYPDDFSFSEAGVAPLTFGARKGDITKITLPTWELLQEAGCVFLPSTRELGMSNGSTKLSTPVGYTGYYWSSTAVNTTNAYMITMSIGNGALNAQGTDARWYGKPVRLVQDYYDPCDAQEIKFKDTTVMLALKEVYYKGTAFGTGKTYSTPNIEPRLTSQRFIVDTLRTALGCDSVYCRIKLTYPIFSISPTQKATFSRGNLQYQRASSSNANYKRFTFATNQYDRQGASNLTTTNESYTTPIDLFSWGATGTGDQKSPNYVSSSTSDFANWVDWGNCGNIIYAALNYPSGVWRTPTIEDWKYLLFDRTTKSGARYAVVWLRRSTTSTDTVSGVVIFPDNFEWAKAGFTTALTVHNSTKYYLNKADWDKLEKAGCAFLPHGGIRNGTTNQFTAAFLGLRWRYWSSTASNTSSADAAYISGHAGNLTWSTQNFNNGVSVRLIRDLPSGYSNE